METTLNPLPPSSSFRIKIMQDASPLDLKTAPAITLGSTLIAPGWDVYANLHRRPDHQLKKDPQAHGLAHL